MTPGRPLRPSVGPPKIACHSIPPLPSISKGISKRYLGDPLASHRLASPPVSDAGSASYGRTALPRPKFVFAFVGSHRPPCSIKSSEGTLQRAGHNGSQSSSITFFTAVPLAWRLCALLCTPSADKRTLGRRIGETILAQAQQRFTRRPRQRPWRIGEPRWGGGSAKSQGLRVCDAYSFHPMATTMPRRIGGPWVGGSADSVAQRRSTPFVGHEPPIQSDLQDFSANIPDYRGGGLGLRGKVPHPRPQANE